MRGVSIEAGLFFSNYRGVDYYRPSGWIEDEENRKKAPTGMKPVHSRYLGRRSAQ